MIDISSDISILPNNVVRELSSIKTIPIKYVDILKNGILDLSQVNFASVGYQSFSSIH
jgi:hypothetical protein